MSKPNINKLGQVGQLFIQEYERYLPTSFDESLSLLEKMNKIIEYMNQIGVLVNGAFDQWNEIMEWVLNDGLNEAVVARLNEMMDNGELAHIINVELLGSRSRITTSTVAPINPNETDYWYQDVGDEPALSLMGTLLVDESQVVYDGGSNE